MGNNFSMSKPKVNIQGANAIQFYSPNKSPDVLGYAFLNVNNISAYFWTTGIFDQNMNLQNAAGLYWPTGSSKTACFTAGLSLACFINGQLAESMASYTGEFTPGYVVNSQPLTSSDFKYYSIKVGDTTFNNPDYANWYKMVPYGAPYNDVNNNGVFDPSIDIPGIKNAAQTVFVCLTDGFPLSHNPGEGFGGGVTNPLMMSEVHFTAWAYTLSGIEDVQYLKWEIVNKGQNIWNKTYFSIISDVDLGDGFDDYVGSDTNRKLGYCYNGTNNDAMYGANPPAFGIRLLRGALRQYQLPVPDSLKMTSFTFFTSTGSGPPSCESDPNGEPYPAYLYMTGVKKDSTPYLNPLIPLGSGTRKTKFCYSGDPETNSGWIEIMGSIPNCGGDTINTPPIPTNPPGDRRTIISSGSVNLQVAPNEKQTIVAAQMVARGNSNTNSVTLLKQLSDVASNYYFNHIVGIKKISELVPEKYQLLQNYPNPFNPSTVIRFDLPKSDLVTLNIYDVSGRLVKTLLNEHKSPGTYEVKFDASEISSGIYFYKLSTSTFSEAKKMIFIK